MRGLSPLLRPFRHHPRRRSPGCDALCGLLCGALVFHSALAPSPAYAVPGLERQESSPEPSPNGESGDFEELLSESQELLLGGRPIDARAKLQKALKINPNDYRPHLLLGQYYLFEVGHFTLAYKYVRTAEELFSKRYGSDLNGTLDRTQWRQHQTILYLRSEAELNLDKYEKSLATLDRFSKLYWADWLPGTKAWVLMKLKRLDEAVREAQAGLVAGADPRRTYNILGILFSVQGNRELSLKAFREAIAQEVGLGFRSQIATPLNNAGEVYREMFRDGLAEASWLRATKLPDGCDHILPSLNLTNLYIDELRLLQAERTLQDFEACYAQQPLRSDTEHRALLALARGRIALRTGDPDKAIALLTEALDREQWFGKIGTNENDVRFASTITMAQALSAKAEALADTVRDTTSDSLSDRGQLPLLRLRAWWLNRQARQISLNELSDLEDLFIRNTDTMIEYPTLGEFLAGFPRRSLDRRIERMLKEDDRKNAHTYYRLYRAANYYEHGDYDDAEKLLQSILSELRPIDRLVRAEALVYLELVTRANGSWIWSPPEQERNASALRREEIFGILPSHLRNYGLRLPVSWPQRYGRGLSSEAAKISGYLAARFEPDDGGTAGNRKFELRVADQGGGSAGEKSVSLSLVERASGNARCTQTVTINADGLGYEAGVNKFITSCFSHRVDPPGEPVPQLELLEGIL